MFLQATRLVMRAQTGERFVSPEKQTKIENEIAYHLGVLKKRFDSGDLDDDLVSNADKTHFVSIWTTGIQLVFV